MFRTRTASYIAQKRHYLFCIAEKNLEHLAEIITKVKENNQTFEVFGLKDTDSLIVLQNWLEKQKMGTYLYIAAEWNELHLYKEMAESAGFSDEEAQYIVVGKKKRKVFCCRCHGITEACEADIQVKNNQLSCIHCQLSLAVSDHYSRIRDAYLGYPTTI